MSAITDIVMPKFGLTMEEGVLVEWMVKPGDRFASGEVIFSVETEKIINDVEATSDGEIVELLIEAGEAVKVGAPVARWRTTESEPSNSTNKMVGASDGDNPPSARSVYAAELQTSVEDPQKTSKAPVEARAAATPRARRLAKAKGVDISKVRGTGPRGRIEAADVEAALKETAYEVAKEESGRRPLTAQEAVIVRQVREAKREIPHFYVAREADVTELEASRNRLNENCSASAKSKISVTHIIIAAVARALVVLPELNRVWDDGAVLTLDTVDVGIAIDTPRGLMLPVIRKAGSMGLPEIAAAASSLVSRARNGSLRQSDIGGGMMSVSNVGMFGATLLVPIISPGQAAILGVGAVRHLFRPDQNDHPHLRKELSLVLSCDHRVLNGVAGARLLDSIVAHLEQPSLLLSNQTN